jgi:hypothetical protein
VLASNLIPLPLAELNQRLAEFHRSPKAGASFAHEPEDYPSQSFSPS